MWRINGLSDQTEEEKKDDSSFIIYISTVTITITIITIITIAVIIGTALHSLWSFSNYSRRYSCCSYRFMAMGMGTTFVSHHLGNDYILMLLFLINTNCCMDLDYYWTLLEHVTIWIHGHVWGIRNSTPYFLWDLLHTHSDRIKRMCLEIEIIAY